MRTPDYDKRVQDLTANAQNQANALEDTDAEIAELRALPPGTPHVPIALNQLNAQRRRQANTLATTQALLDINQNLQAKARQAKIEAYTNAAKQPEQKAKR